MAKDSDCKVWLPREPIAVNDLPKYLPRQNGKQINRSTVWRWIRNGLRGVAPLESFAVGRRRFVTRDAVRRFLADCDAAGSVGQVGPAIQVKRPAKVSAATLTILRRHGITNVGRKENP